VAATQNLRLATVGCPKALGKKSFICGQLGEIFSKKFNPLKFPKKFFHV
jgi:hypothetical protein